MKKPNPKNYIGNPLGYFNDLKQYQIGGTPSYPYDMTKKSERKADKRSAKFDKIWNKGNKALKKGNTKKAQKAYDKLNKMFG